MTDRDALHALVDTLPDDALASAEMALRELADEVVPPEVEARIIAARRSIAEGRGVHWHEVDAQLRAVIAAARTR